MNPIILDIIKVGFHGAAIAMAYLTYKLIHRTLEKDLLDEGRLERILGSVKLFMWLCAGLFIVGVGAQLYTPTPRQNAATLMVTPSPWPKQLKNYEELVLVSHGNDKIDLIKGRGVIEVSDKDDIRIGIEELVDVLTDLNDKNRALLRNATPEGGFGQ